MYQGNFGIELDFPCIDQDENPLNISEIKEAFLFIQRGEEVIKRVMSIGANSLYYRVIEGDLSISGNYTLQPHLCFYDGGEIDGSPTRIKVETPLSIQYEGNDG